MKENYEINKNTLALIPVSKKTTMVYELDGNFLVNKSTSKIIEESCNFFGSSYEGRFIGTKQLVGYSYKAPIIVEESNKLIFFPTTSPRLDCCCWISLNNVMDYMKDNDKIGNSIIISKSNQKVSINLSYNSLENQILRATKLWCTLEKNMQKL